jgi:hypothetical protein
MKKLILMLLSILIVVAMVTPAFAEFFEKDGSSSPDDFEYVSDDDEEDEDEDDDKDDDKDDNKADNTAEETQEEAAEETATEQSVTVSAIDEEVIADLLTKIGADDLIVAFNVDIAENMAGEPCSFIVDALATADGNAPDPMPTLYMVVGDVVTPLVYGVDYTVDWATGTITINSVPAACTLAFV